jgi:hypothetical protein
MTAVIASAAVERELHRRPALHRRHERAGLGLAGLEPRRVAGRGRGRGLAARPARGGSVTGSAGALDGAHVLKAALAATSKELSTGVLQRGRRQLRRRAHGPMVISSLQSVHGDFAINSIDFELARAPALED